MYLHVLSTETREWVTQQKQLKGKRPRSTNEYGLPPPCSGVLMEKGRTYTGRLVPEALLPEPTVMGFGTGELIEEGERGSTPLDVPLGSLCPTLP